MRDYTLAAALVAATIAALSVACTTAEAPAPPPPPAVVVEVPVQRDVQNFDEFPGTLRAFEEVEIRARVEGFLETMEFQPTSSVRRNQVLFVIEQAPFEAQRDRAVADVQGSEAAVRRAESDLERLELAVRTNAVSQQEVTRARAERDQSQAALLAAQAAQAQAEINLDYATIESPIDGVIGRNLVDLGNVVGRGETTLLAYVSRVDPIHAYFELPERAVAQLLDERGGLRPQDEPDQARKVYVSVDGVDRVFEGRLDFIDPRVNSSTGTVEVRGRIPNPEGRLLPGFFVRVRVPGRLEPGALLVQETALAADLGGRYLLVVGEDNVVNKRYTELGALEEDGLRVIRDGIAAGERYIVQGLQRARPGMPVNPKTAPAASGDSGN
jgi:RND family efflux transporter MFP subunit